MTTSELIAKLIASGTPGDLVAEVANRLFSLESQFDALTKARKANAERQQRWRVRNVMSRDVTLHDPAYIEEKKDKIKKASICRTALPADFELNEADMATCEKVGWDQARTTSELQRFKDHAAANGRRQIDWHASWRNWVTSPLQTPTKPNGGTNGHHANPAAIRRTSDAVNETLARRQERFRFG